VDIERRIAAARGLVFDCDGTLVDTLPVHAKAWAVGFATSGVEMAPDWYWPRSGFSEVDILDAFERDHGVVLDREHTTTTQRRAFHDHIADLREIAVVAAIARAQHGKLPMAVASSGWKSIVVPSLDAAGLSGLFDTVVTIDDVAEAKPAPDLFLEAARRLGVAPADCLVFEDSAQGLEAARLAGMPAVDVREL
jgi:HAD superfamily hydrolase (TIGR01509 family)